MAKSDRIRADNCTIRDRTPCTVKVALGMAADDSRKIGAPNATRLRELARELQDGGSVSLAEAKRELTTWVKAATGNPAVPEPLRTRATVVAEALHLRV
jgi:hypothetical protein